MQLRETAMSKHEIYRIEGLTNGGFIVYKLEATVWSMPRAVSTLEEALDYLRKRFTVPPDEPVLLPPSPPEPRPSSPALVTWEDVPIDRLELSFRTSNALNSFGELQTVGQLEPLSSVVLRRIPGIGPVSAREIENVIGYHRKDGWQKLLEEHSLITLESEFRTDIARAKNREKGISVFEGVH
jgi:hypothetical protein